MRIYLPSTSTGLRELLDRGALGPPPLTAFAVTPGLREWYSDDDLDELEYAASAEAARASLRMIDVDDTAAARRVVIAADVADAAVTVHDDIDRGVVRVGQAIPLSEIASVHVDDVDAEATVRAAARAVVAADLGEPTAQDHLDDAEGHELSWFATQEIEGLLADL